MFKAQKMPPHRTDGAFTIARPASPIIQRKCGGCGQHTVAGGGCSECEKGKGFLQRRATGNEATGEAPPIVDEVLRSPGQPLEASTRKFMEPRFGHDFSGVRVHTDAKAAESARAVNALAYTVGRDIVFGFNNHAPDSSAGRELLAHELAHVMQQERFTSGNAPARVSQPSDTLEANADRLSRSALSGERPAGLVSESSSPVLSRRVIPGLVHCTASSDGAPADPVPELTAIVDQAEEMARSASLLLKLNAAMIRFGAHPFDSTLDIFFDDRFGGPPEVSGGFMNRLTGAVRPTLDIALSEEMDLTATRYDLIANQLGKGFIHYLCMSTTGSFGGCTVASCIREAWACPGVNAIFLCPGFWGGDTRTSSTLLIHETSHMIWESVFHGAGGSGGNFRHAECYASFVSDIFGSPPGEPACPLAIS